MVVTSQHLNDAGQFFAEAERWFIEGRWPMCHGSLGTLEILPFMIARDQSARGAEPLGMHGSKPQFGAMQQHAQVILPNVKMLAYLALIALLQKEHSQ